MSGQLWLDELTNAPRGTTLRVSIAYADGENTVNDEPLAAVAPLTAVFGLAYDNPSETWGGELSWLLAAAKEGKDIPENDAGTKYDTPGYGVVDLTAYYKPVNGLTLQLGLFNLTDKEYWHWEDLRGLTTDGREATPASGFDRYSQPGRNFSISAEYVF